MDSRNSEGNHRRTLLSIVLPELATIDAEHAIRVALGEAVDSPMEVGLEATVVQRLSEVDIERAKSILPHVRNGLTKLDSFGRVGLSLVKNDKFEEAFALGLQLPESMRNPFNGNLVSDWSMHDPIELFNSIDRVPTKEAKSRAAVWLHAANQREKLFTNEQVEYLKSFLLDLDAVAIGDAPR